MQVNRVAPTPAEIRTGLGAAFAAGVAIYGAARRWMVDRPTQQKINAVAGELGVCESGVPSGAPTLASLVMSTATAVQRLERHAEENKTGIQKILDVQEVHGNKLDTHERRLETVETRSTALNIQSEALDANIEAVKANVEAVKANIAAVQSSKEAALDRQHLAKQFTEMNINVKKLLAGQQKSVEKARK